MIRAFKLIVAEDMKDNVSKEERDYLRGDGLKEWKVELEAIIDDLVDQIQDIYNSRERDEKQYKGDAELLDAAQQAWEGKVRSTSHRLYLAESALLEADQLYYARFATTDPASQASRVGFLEAAIQAHREIFLRAMEHENVAAADLSLYDALEGRWTFTSPPPLDE